MDNAISTFDAYQQATARFMQEGVDACVAHCVTSYEHKELSLTEKNCVNTCYKKQVEIADRVASMMTGKWRVTSLLFVCP